MAHFCVHDINFHFPPVNEADEDGLLLIGGEVTPERILEAYPKGIFPWYNEDELPLWWSPDPRFVLFPEELHMSKSMRKVFIRDTFQFKIDSAFELVIQNCETINRKGQDATWLTQEMKQAYTELFYKGYAHCAEAWYGSELVGGVYGIKMGRVFFGESMFSKVANASKFAFLNYVKQLHLEGISLIDCQVYTEHVASLGARLISRDKFVHLLRDLI